MTAIHPAAVAIHINSLTEILAVLTTAEAATDARHPEWGNIWAAKRKAQVSLDMLTAAAA